MNTMNTSERVAENRREWAVFGFKHSTFRMHKDDLALGKAFMDVLLAERLAWLAEGDEQEEYAFVAARNIKQMPTAFEQDAAEQLTNGEHLTETRRREIKSQFAKARANMRAAVKANTGRIAEPTNLMYEAQFVAYSNLAAAYMRYGMALVAHDLPLTEGE